MGWFVAVLLLLVLTAAAILWWSLRTESGTAWLLRQLPGVAVEAPRGALLGDFAAERLSVRWGAGDEVVLTRLASDDLRIGRAAGAGVWLKLSIARLSADRIDWLPSPRKDTPATRSDPVTELRLPVEVEIAAIEVGEVHAAALGDQPVRDLRAAVHLGGEAGRLHRLDKLSLAWDQLRAGGSATLEAAAPMALVADIDVMQPPGAPAASPVPPWQATLHATGPLADLAVQARLRTLDAPAAGQPPGVTAPGTPTPPASAIPPSTPPAAPGQIPPTNPPAAGASPGAYAPQSLTAQARIRPFADWPLVALQAQTENLDASAFHAAAPQTSLTGSATVETTAVDQPAIVQLDLRNALAGRWNEGRLPLRQMSLRASGPPDRPSDLTVSQLEADLGTADRTAGRITGQGRYAPEGWRLEALLQALQPAGLDARAPAMELDGPVTVSGNTDAAGLFSAQIETRLNGRLLAGGTRRAATPTVQLLLDAGGNERQVELRRLQARTGDARADASGMAQRAAPDAPWRVRGKASVAEFDPLPWWPGAADSPLRQGSHRLNAQAELDLTLPPPTTPPRAASRAASPGHAPAPAQSVLDLLASLQGQAELRMEKSLLAGVPLNGTATFNGESGPTARIAARLQAAGNSIAVDGRPSVAPDAESTYAFTVSAPQLAQLGPLYRLLPGSPADARVAGSVEGEGRLSLRGTALSTIGSLTARAVRVGEWRLDNGDARWELGTAANAPMTLEATLNRAAAGEQVVDRVRVDLQGTAQSHRLEGRAEIAGSPPAWADVLQPQAVPAGQRSVALIEAEGGFLMKPGAPGSAMPQASGWRGTLQQLDLRSNAPGAVPWARAEDITLETSWPTGAQAGPARVVVQPGSVLLPGQATLRWSRVSWQAEGPGTPAQIEADATLEPLQVSPLLARLQPDFGWGGDLALGGTLSIRSAPEVRADIVIERRGGDLTVTDETGTQSLGLTDLRFGVNADNGVWSFTQGLAGETLGVAAGAVVARTSPTAIFPAADTPIQGVFQIQVANLGAWGTWVPAGWRLSGSLGATASIGGRFGAPEYTGNVIGNDLGARNLLLGVNVTDGDLAVALQGASASIQRFTARAGAGTVRLAGDAKFGESPRAQLNLVAERFQLLGRVDRRVVVSGQARLDLDRDTLALDGNFGIDEGLIDITQGDAPSLSDDVVVVRAPVKPDADPARQPANDATVAAAPQRDIRLDLRVGLGEQLRLRGRGIDTGLRGELHITAPKGQLAVNGTVRTVGGRFAAYGQRLVVERGVITFNGPVDNPRLDIEATRPNVDVRVGVAVTGFAVNPQVRLFSEPDLPEIDKLSWLVLGRASDGGADSALLQQAAMALLAGDGEGTTDRVSRALGLDEISLRQGDGAGGQVRDTIVSVGKQISRRWYVGYERSLNATEGNWQLIYRIAQRFTLRAQSGRENSLDLIWTWRWQ